MTAITATKKPVLPIRKVDGFGLTIMDLQGLRKGEVVTVLKATGMGHLKVCRFLQLWEVVKPEHLFNRGLNDNEACGILAHALFLHSYGQEMDGEVRYLFDRAGHYMRNRIESGDYVSDRVLQVWLVLRWMMLDWQRRTGGV